MVNSYDLRSFGRMITDEVRMKRYYEALKRAIRPGDVVVDIGAGTGIFSLFACQLGAKRVYAIEPNGWIGLVKPLAEKNGFGDRIIPIRKTSDKVNLSEQADVIIGDLRGSHPLTHPNLSSLNDARQRWLKPGGVIIPQRDSIFVTLVSLADYYEKNFVHPWQKNDYNLDLTEAYQFAPNILVQTTKFEGDAHWFESRLWTEIDYASGKAPKTEATLEWIASEHGQVHFALFWFEAQLVDGVRFTTAPWDPEHTTIYGYSLLPLQAPLDFVPGDKITFDLRANLAAEGYIFSWNTSQRADEGRGAVKAAFQQSTFKGSMQPFQLLNRSRRETPSSLLNPNGQVARVVLNGLQAGVPTAEIVTRVCQNFPNLYAEPDAAQLYVNELAKLYGR